jgi:hypothetical protein
MAYMHALGLDVGDLIKKGGPAVDAASKVIADPALPEVVCQILRLNKITTGTDAGIPCAKRVYSAVEKHQGVGLTRVTTPLRIAVWARAHPGVAIAAGVGLVGLIGYVGYMIGKR